VIAAVRRPTAGGGDEGILSHMTVTSAEERWMTSALSYVSVFRLLENCTTCRSVPLDHKCAIKSLDYFRRKSECCHISQHDTAGIQLHQFGPASSCIDSHRRPDR